MTRHLDLIAFLLLAAAAAGIPCGQPASMPDPGAGAAGAIDPAGDGGEDSCSPALSLIQEGLRVHRARLPTPAQEPLEEESLEEKEFELARVSAAAAGGKEVATEDSPTFVVGSRNTDSCSGGTKSVANEAECKSASVALKIPEKDCGGDPTAPKGCTGDYIITPLAAYPKGCWVDGPNMYWNTHATGRASPSGMPICKKEPPNDGRLMDNGCPSKIRHRYPGTDRCFAKIWRNPSCNMGNHPGSDKPCDFAKGPLPDHGTRQANGCPSKRPHRYPGTDRCFEEKWKEEACNIRGGDALFTPCRFGATDTVRYKWTINVGPNQLSEPTLASIGSPRDFSTYLKNVIFPLAATKSKKLVLCVSGNTFTAYAEWDNEAQFEFFKGMTWKPMEFWAAWGASGSSGAGLGLELPQSMNWAPGGPELSKQAFDRGVAGTGCEVI